MNHIVIRQVKAAEIKIFVGTICPDQAHIQFVFTNIMVIGSLALNAPFDQSAVAVYAEPAAGGIGIVLRQVAASFFRAGHGENSVRFSLCL